MGILKGLKPNARVLLTEDFRKGDPETVDAADFVVDLELGRMIDLTPIRAVVGEARKRFEFEPWKSDPWLGPRVHATLRLTRREAADKCLWEYLTVVEFPDYVRWRWSQENPENPIPLDRYLGEDSTNSFARLWWRSELTRNGSDYSRAQKACTVSQFFVWQGLNYAHHRAAALAAVDFLCEFGRDGATNPQTRAMAKAVNVALRTTSLDVLASSPPTDAEAVQEWINEKIDETTMMDELPKGPDEAPIPEGDIAAVRKFLDALAERINLSEAKERKPGRPLKAEARAN